MSSRSEIKASPVLRFLIFYIAEFSDMIGVTHNVGYDILNKYGVLKYLSEFYDILHSQGRLYVLIEIVELLQDKGYYSKDIRIDEIIPELQNMSEGEGYL